MCSDLNESIHTDILYLCLNPGKQYEGNVGKRVLKG